MDDDFDISDIPMPEQIDEPISLEEDDNTIPFDDTDESGVSHAPLSLGGDSTAGAPKIEMPKAVKKPTEKIVSVDRITGMRIFFTKLHAGSVDFLSEQISNWLKANPGAVIKRTNVVTGLVAAKKTEPNLIITVWY